MNIDSLFPSRFLKASDLGGTQKTFTINGITVEEMTDGNRKPALSFAEADKALVLNRTNAGVISAAFGRDTDTWSGKKLTLFSTPVTFQGRLVDAIRVRAVEAPKTEAADADFDDDIPI